MSKTRSTRLSSSLKTVLSGSLLAATTAAHADATVSVAPSSAYVGGAGTSTTMQFPVTRSGDSVFDVSMRYTTSDGSAKAGTDYVATSGELVIKAGQTSGTVSVPIIGVTNGKPNRTFTLTLSNLVAGTPTPGALMFQSNVSAPVGPNGMKAVTADFNGDGAVDVAIASLAGDSTSYPLNFVVNTTPAGAASFSGTVQTIRTPVGVASAMAVGDFNQDGRPDLVLADSSNTNIQLLLNKTPAGASTLSFSANTLTGVPTYSVAVADFDGDGKSDLAVGRTSDKTAWILLNRTTAGASTVSFTAAQSFPTNDQPTALIATDINGDGKPDLVTGYFSSSTVSVLINTSDSTLRFAAPKTTAAANVVWHLDAGDLNGDGKPDLVATSNTTWNSATVTSVITNTTPTGSATPSFGAAQALIAGAPYDAMVADVDADGLDDIVVADVYADSSANGAVLVYRNTTSASGATPTFASPLKLQPASDEPRSVVMADFNRDGRNDLATASFDLGTSTPLYLFMASSTAKAGFGTASATGTINPCPSSRVICKLKLAQ